MNSETTSTPTHSTAPLQVANPSSATTKSITDRMQISVIIPTYNEETVISSLIKYLLAEPSDDLREVLVIDGGSTDQTVALARKAGAQVHTCPQKGRAQQMNLGATLALGNVFYFVHADTRPPSDYVTDIEQSLRVGYSIGSYRSRFCSAHPMLKLNSYFSRFDRFTCRGGDQTLFVTRSLFNEVGGYDDYYVVMEDFDFIRRARRRARFQVMPRDAYVSARKYEDNSYGRVTLANFIVFTMFRLGFSPQTLLSTYKRMVRYPKY